MQVGQRRSSHSTCHQHNQQLTVTVHYLHRNWISATAFPGAVLPQTANCWHLPHPQEGFVANDDASAADDYAREEDEEWQIKEMMARATAQAEAARQQAAMQPTIGGSGGAGGAAGGWGRVVDGGVRLR